MHSICLGDEAVIDTGTFVLEGRTMRPVRQACNRTKNHGVTVRIVREGALDEETRRALLDIDALDRGRESERGFSMALDGLLTNPSRDAECLIVIADIENRASRVPALRAVSRAAVGSRSTRCGGWTVSTANRS